MEVEEIPAGETTAVLTVSTHVQIQLKPYAGLELLLLPTPSPEHNAAVHSHQCECDMQAKRLMQETRYELWIPVHHARQLHHWAAATDALDHVILTAAALESVLEGDTLPTVPCHCRALRQIIVYRIRLFCWHLLAHVPKVQASWASASVGEGYSKTHVLVERLLW